MALCDIFKGKNAANATDETSKPEEPSAKEEKWIWVTGYKGTYSDMTARNAFKYELGETYTMPDDVEIKACESGFHFSKWLSDAQKYYAVKGGNRFFEVTALVRKEDWDKRYHTDKLVAKSIKLVRELSTDEILIPCLGDERVLKWPDKYRQLARTMGVQEAFTVMECDELEAFGYANGFALYIVANGLIDVAKAVGSQTELSMDMKAFIIMQTMILNSSKNSSSWSGRLPRIGR